MSDLLLQDSHIPAPFRNVTYRDYWDTDATRKKVLRVVANWKPTLDEPNLLLYGRPGLGKTLLASASLNERQRLFEFQTRSGKSLPSECLPALRQHRFPVYFIQLAELIDLHIRSIGMSKGLEKGLTNGEEYSDLVNLLEDLTARARFLVIDDVGKEHSTQSGFSIDTFDLLVRSRYANGFSTIFTSNLPLSRWESSYSDSMRDFIERTSRVVHFA